MRDIDRLLAKAQDLLDQAWRTAQTKREVIALVDAYHDVRRARATLHLALTPQPVKYRPPSRSKLRSEEHTSELQSRENLVCRLLLEKKNHRNNLAKK